MSQLTALEYAQLIKEIKGEGNGKLQESECIEHQTTEKLHE
jgi:hypothetical protein